MNSIFIAARLAPTPANAGKTRFLGMKINNDKVNSSQDNDKAQISDERKESLSRVVTLTLIGFLVFMVISVSCCVYLYKRGKKNSRNQVSDLNRLVNLQIAAEENGDLSLDDSQLNLKIHEEI